MKRAIVLISSGIDSAVAAYLTKKEGWEVEYLHFDRNSKERVIEIIKIFSDNRLYVLSHEELMRRIFSVNPGDCICVYCKAGMLLTAEKLAKRVNCSIIVTGDNLGQVASQTVLNIKSEESIIKMPVVRPLIGLDKEEIVEIAKKIGTYSKTKGGDSCPYAPKHPVTSGCDVENLKNRLSDIDRHIEQIII